MNEMWIALEGGGTKTRVMLADTAGRILASEVGGTASNLYTKPGPFYRATRRLLERVRRVAVGRGRARRPGRPGCTDAPRASRAGRQGRLRPDRHSFGSARATWHSPGTAFGRGLSLIAGTGSCARFTTPRGAGTVAGGHGPQFGDEGSGYWIGREAFRAVAHGIDGRGPRTLLEQKLLEVFEVDHPIEVYRFCGQNGVLPAPKVAAFVPAVIAAAREGDAVAKGILRGAGRELAGLILATVRQHTARKQPIPVVLSGGVFHAGPLVITSLKRALGRSGKTFDVYPPVPEPCEGIIKFIKMYGARRKRRVSRRLLRRG